MPGSTYVEWEPREALRGFLVCGWAREPSVGDGGRILPDGCIDVVWDGRRAFVAGPDTGPVVTAPTGDIAGYAGARFRPGAAPALLGLPASALRDQRVPLDAIWDGGSVRAVTDRLAGAPSMRAAGGVLQRAVEARLDRAIDPLVTGAVAEIATRPSARVSELADELGVTERTLRRRVEAAVGYAPKTLQRIVRFRRFLALAHASTDGLSALAFGAGYADQAHLTRECRSLSGLTPGDLLRDRDVRLVQDGLTPATENHP